MDFGALLGLVGTRIGGLAPYDGTDRHDALGHRDRGSLMRHYFWLLSLSLSPPVLPGGVSPRTAAAPLVACLSLPLRLAATDLCALARAVHVAVIAAFTDTHLHLTTLTVVEPVRRLPHRPQRLPPETLDSARAGRHKGPAHCLSQALRIGGPGVVTPIKNPGPRSTFFTAA
jgi:hypothetical protein